MEEFARSDLAAECGAARDGEGIRATRADACGCEILRVQIKSKEAAARVGKPEGRYVTVDCGDLCDLSGVELEQVRRTLAVELRDMAERMCGKRVGKGFSLLVVGLGNAAVTPDAIGPETVKRLSVTRHMEGSERALFGAEGLCEIAAIAPGVPGQTGMETVEAVRGAVLAVSPDLVVAVDALSARSPAKLAATVQLSDAGICPGSGVGNARGALTGKTVGAPVMALGVPTVIDSATLTADALRRTGYAEISEEIRGELRAARRYFVTPRDVDLLVASAGALLAGALEKAFSPGGEY